LSICKAETHDVATKFYYWLFNNYTQNGDPGMVTTIPMLPKFWSQFFEQSQALIPRFNSLTFSHSLDYATIASMFPEHISFWHFVPSLKTYPTANSLHMAFPTPVGAIVDELLGLSGPGLPMGRITIALAQA